MGFVAIVLAFWVPPATSKGFVWFMAIFALGELAIFAGTAPSGAVTSVFYAIHLPSVPCLPPPTPLPPALSLPQALDDTVLSAVCFSRSCYIYVMIVIYILHFIIYVYNLYVIYML